MACGYKSARQFLNNAQQILHPYTHSTFPSCCCCKHLST